MIRRHKEQSETSRQEEACVQLELLIQKLSVFWGWGILPPVHLYMILSIPLLLIMAIAVPSLSEEVLEVRLWQNFREF
jgi:hypothetical protein